MTGKSSASSGRARGGSSSSSSSSSRNSSSRSSNSSNKQSSSSHNQNVGSGGTGQPYKSDYAMVKEGGWSNMHGFMHSYGIKPTGDGAYGEAKAILEGFREHSQQK
ncbi:hypothetical protein CBR_g30389 [Chara braunii]|uniref:Uncharacterized protein n=1 Tax=Chara braunii TaxID=69332 RepID=A0A388JXC4_CHABU|nr:hypothetical protein CBR_g30389 [Chara braunii]|eukprot:GBG62435.1 hypothetical protein CBR_g30389 [Chara braunii]